MATPELTTPLPYVAANPPSWLHRLLALIILTACAWGAWTFPVGSNWLLVAFGVYLLVLQRYPHAWLMVLPAALPILDLAYWSGRFFFNEYDLLVLMTLAWGLWRYPAPLARANLHRRVAAVMALLLLIEVPIVLNGLLPMHTPVPGAWTDYFASTNALREGKGILWAILLMPMLAAVTAQTTDARRLLCVGMMAGLMLAIGTIVWERLLFTGLFDLRNPYRVSGWFSGMHTGGAAVDSYLALASPFVLSAFVFWRDRRVHVFGMALGVAALYALYVTYSRANYPAVAVMIAIVIFGIGVARLRHAARNHTKDMLFIGAIAIALIALGLGGGENIQSRFKTTINDLNMRMDHWSGVSSIMAGTPTARWLGMGKGVFPRAYFWQHQMMGDGLSHAALLQEDNETFVRFSKSDRNGTMDLRQRFDVAGGGQRLRLKLRVAHGQAERLLIEFCERHILRYLAECKWRGVNIPATTTDWQEFNVPVALPDKRETALGIFTRPFEVSIMNRGIKQGLDIGAAQILGADGRALLLNPDFSSGWDNWFMVYGDHLRWHIKNVFIYWFFEGGLLGMLAMLALCVYVGVHLLRHTAGGDRFALITAAALGGVLMVGLFDSLFDEPRITMLTLFLGMAALQLTRPQKRRAPPPEQAS